MIDGIFRSWDTELTDDQLHDIGSLADSCDALSVDIMLLCPDNKSREIAIIKLREIAFWASASIGEG